MQVVVLTSFFSYESDATLAQRGGGIALLPQQVSAACASVLKNAMSGEINVT